MWNVNKCGHEIMNIIKNLRLHRANTLLALLVDFLNLIFSEGKDQIINKLLYVVELHFSHLIIVFISPGDRWHHLVQNTKVGKFEGSENECLC